VKWRSLVLPEDVDPGMSGIRRRRDRRRASAGARQERAGQPVSWRPIGGTPGRQPIPGGRVKGGHVARHRTRPIARAQRKAEAHNVTAQAGYLSSVRSRRAAPRSELPRSELPIAPAEIIPEQPIPARPALATPGHHYLAKKHVRRDIGSHIQVLDLAARNAPASAPPAVKDHEGEPMPFLVSCLTHGGQKYFRAYNSAVRAAKASHHWCEGCKKEVIAFHKLHARVSRPAQR
jgi:hypothetical protein